jgi:hypothetical protein
MDGEVRRHLVEVSPHARENLPRRRCGVPITTIPIPADRLSEWRESHYVRVTVV